MRISTISPPSFYLLLDDECKIFILRIFRSHKTVCTVQTKSLNLDGLFKHLARTLYANNINDIINFYEFRHDSRTDNAVVCEIRFPRRGDIIRNVRN